MNAIQKLVVSAGQKSHEDFYGAVFTWNKRPFPCTHGDVTKNPALIMGGFSPDTDVIVSVRDELFGDSAAVRPKKGDYCSLKPSPDDNRVFSLQIWTVMTSVGDSLLKFVCKDSSQKA